MRRKTLIDAAPSLLVKLARLAGAGGGEVQNGMNSVLRSFAERKATLLSLRESRASGEVRGKLF